jgi:hypothetical protein
VSSLCYFRLLETTATYFSVVNADFLCSPQHDHCKSKSTLLRDFLTEDSHLPRITASQPIESLDAISLNNASFEPSTLPPPKLTVIVSPLYYLSLHTCVSESGGERGKASFLHSSPNLRIHKKFIRYFFPTAVGT